MSRPCIVNFINFIRAVEPRCPMDLVLPVQEQIRLHQHHNLPATWLLQYDALISGPYVEMLKALGPEHEIGVWLEIVQPLVEKAGLNWRGRYPWDWHSHVGFSIGYTPAERERMLDIFMADFKHAFGRYPVSMGSWLFDAHTLEYLHKNYGIVAACNCKDQFGTDGYTLWGGYWNQAYYPSRKNAIMPAQTEAEQIPVPIFRMLGSDPIYQYDCGMNPGHNCSEVEAQGVVSLEPVYKGGGGNPAWVRWFFSNLLQQPSLAFQYAQAGQENSFGWEGMSAGYIDQINWLAQQRQLRDDLRIETLEASARWFCKAYPLTPPSSVSAIGDHEDKQRSSAWYNSRNYRLNLCWYDGFFRIRDIHKFDEGYTERYLTSTCTTQASTYDTLPIVEGFLWSGAGVLSGLNLLTTTGEPICCGKPELSETAPGELTARWSTEDGTSFRAICSEKSFTCEASSNGWELSLRWKPEISAPFQQVDGREIHCVHEGYEYSLRCACGSVELDSAHQRLCLRPENGRITLAL